MSDNRFKILAADKLAKEGLDFLAAQPDVQVANKPGLSEDELAAIVGEYDAMIVRSGVTVTAKVLSKPGRLKAIARAGVGVDNIDVDAATAAGILVVNTPDANTISTAEHALTLMMALARNIGPAYKAMAGGGWDRNKFQGRQLAGKTLGVVGFGRIGRAVAERALGLSMNVLAYDPFVNAATAMDGRVKMFKQFDEILPHADILTFHVPGTDETRGMLNASNFSRCRKGVLLVNAARGGIIDEAALLEAVKSGQVGGAALDVYTAEPPPADSPLRNQPNILTTPHLGASTAEAQQAVSIEAAQSLLMFLRGEGVSGAVNAAGFRLDLDPIQQRFVDLAQRMAKLLTPMLTQGLVSVTFEVQGAELAAAASTLERMGLIGLLQSHMDASLNIVNVMRVAEQRGIAVRTVKTETSGRGGPQLAIEVRTGDEPDSSEANRTRRIVGRVYSDNRPRVVEINGYHMDMVPAGVMVLILNEDRPGMIGMVGTEFGQAQVNIADMAISRRDATALMVLKVDDTPPDALLNRMRHRPGIVKVAMVRLPAE
jgi:D-3-phosphoglycerate dehydrogenase